MIDKLYCPLKGNLSWAKSAADRCNSAVLMHIQYQTKIFIYFCFCPFLSISIIVAIVIAVVVIIVAITISNVVIAAMLFFLLPNE